MKRRRFILSICGTDLLLPEDLGEYELGVLVKSLGEGIEVARDWKADLWKPEERQGVVVELKSLPAEKIAGSSGPLPEVIRPTPAPATGAPDIPY